MDMIDVGLESPSALLQASVVSTVALDAPTVGAHAVTVGHDLVSSRGSGVEVEVER